MVELTREGPMTSQIEAGFMAGSRERVGVAAMQRESSVPLIYVMLIYAHPG